jgi:hypothetical protein
MPRDFSQEFPKPWSFAINDVPCAIYHGENDEGHGLSESYGYDGRRAIVNFICYWDDRLDLIAGLVGTVDYVAGTIVRKEPFAYPLADRDQQQGKMFPNRLFCTAVTTIEGRHSWTDFSGENTGEPSWPGYCYAIVQAEFTSPPYLIIDLLGTGVPTQDPAFNDLTYQTYVISRVDVAGEVFSPPSGSFIWAAGGHNNEPILDVGASQIRSRFEISVTRVRMPLIPMTTMTSLMGTVNSQQFLVGGQMFPPNSMLFMGGKPESRSDPYNGGIIWDIEYKWMANGQAAGQNTPLDWNFFLDPDGNWNQIKTRVGGNPVFAPADHAALFSDTIN